MKEQLHRGKIKYVGYILLDLACLLLSNFLAVRFYETVGSRSNDSGRYIFVIICMIVIDVFVSLVFNTLKGVIRRRKRIEVVQSFKQVVISFAILAIVLFSTKQGTEFSRLTIYTAYALYLILIILAHILLRSIVRRKNAARSTPPSVLLVTTDGYARDGLAVAAQAGMDIQGIFVTDKTNEYTMDNIPVIVDRKDAVAFLAWEQIDRVYICGPNSIDVPEVLLRESRNMGISVFRNPIRTAPDIEIIGIQTALSKEDQTSGLSFFESERDIPMQIRCFYTIFESEQEKQRGFHAHKQSWHFLFCPYGSIDVIVDTGKERKTISLSKPSEGVILNPHVWREMVWKKQGSVLCVAASDHYDYDKLNSDYSEYLQFLRIRDWSATIESAEVLGGIID